MAWRNHETVDRFHGALVLAERELNRRGASGVVALARERDDPGCATAIELPLGEYERAVKPIDRFVVAQATKIRPLRS